MQLSICSIPGLPVMSDILYFLKIFSASSEDTIIDVDFETVTDVNVF